MRVGQRAAAGFTLLEMLVVVAVIGIILSFAVLNLGGDRRAEELSAESRRFAELLRLASEQAVLRGEEWGVQIDLDEYRFLLYRDDGWALREGDDLFHPRTLAPDTELDIELEGRDLVLENSGEIKPTLLLLSSGEVSPFTAVFATNATEYRYRVQADLFGDIHWEALEPW